LGVTDRVYQAGVDRTTGSNGNEGYSLTLPDLETAFRGRAASIAALLDPHSNDLGDESLSQATHLGMMGNHASKWAAPAANYELAINPLDFRGPSD
jgi:hypothetical protein